MESTTDLTVTMLLEEGTSVPVISDGESLVSNSSDYCGFQPVRSLILIPFGIITIFALPGNVLVMLAVCRERRLQNPTNVFVVGLAVADIVNGLLSIPSAYFWFVSYCDDLVILYFRCAVRTCCGCSVTHLVLVSIDRYVAVSKPLKYPSLITRRRARISSAISWVVIVTYMLIVSIIYHLEETGVIKVNQVAFVIFWNYFPSSCIVIAMVVTSVIYAYVLRQAHKLRSRMTSMARSSFQLSARSRRRTKQQKATITLAFVVLAFAICWLPISITLFLDNGPGYNPDISLGPTMFYYANSIMNPLIYAHRSKDFREAFKSILCDAFFCFGPYERDVKFAAPSASDSNKQSFASGPQPESEKQEDANGYPAANNHNNGCASV